MQPESIMHQVTCLCGQQHDCSYHPREIPSLEEHHHSAC